MASDSMTDGVNEGAVSGAMQSTRGSLEKMSRKQRQSSGIARIHTN
jgi:hypothetical protein